MNTLINLILDAMENNTFIRCIWSNPRQASDCKKIAIRPILIKENLFYQISKTIDTKEYHQNLSLVELQNWIPENCFVFKQFQLFTTTEDYHALINKKQKATIKKSSPSLTLPTSLSHNRQKKYILDTSSSMPFLKSLGLMDEHGQIKPSKYDKYKQINRYLEIVADSIAEVPEKKLRIIDFGCGKSYLTFALYHYLTVLLEKEVEVIGLDLKADVITFCKDLAKQLGYTNLHFQVGDIGKYTTDQPIDMVVSLHACNTATDAAIEKAIRWKSKIILAVPCCHHEAYTQIQNDSLNPILKHGILKERIAALVTDGLRAQLLETVGYKVNMIEFIDMAHTPKNILIKAILKKNGQFDPNAYRAYEETSDMLHLNLSLPNMLNDLLEKEV